MGNKVLLTVHWNSGGQVSVFELVHSGSSSWRITQREGISFMIIREKPGLRHEIPLDNVLYWSVDTVVTNDSASNEIFDRYCNSCKTYFSEDGSVGAYIHRDHDVRRTCCGASPNNDHHPACTQDESSSYKRIGTITDISEDDNGLNIAWKPFSPIRTLSDFLDKYDR